MRIETNHIIIRDFERKDAENLYQIVREKNIFRFMPDWEENNDSPKAFLGYIDWHQTQKDSTDVYENKRYAIALPDTDEMIGMVGMGLEDTVNEVEVAYFMSEKYQGNAVLNYLKNEHQLNTNNPTWKAIAISITEDTEI